MSKFQLNFTGSKEELHAWLKQLKKDEGENINTFIIKAIEEKKKKIK